MNNQIETMDKRISSNTETKPEKQFSPEVLAWLSFIEKISLFPPHNIEAIAKSAEEAKKEGVSLPFIINLCPAIENLEQPTESRQTRKLIPLSEDNPRLKNFIQELASFMVATKDILGITPEIFLIFSDVLESDVKGSIINTTDIVDIANQSVKTIQQLFLQIDQANPGLFQEKEIRIPKIHFQSKVMEQTGKVGFNPAGMTAKVEFEELDPNSPAHEVFERLLKVTRDDRSFRPTSWQTQAGREAIHNKVRFSTAQCWVDGVVLPKIMEKLFQKRFPKKMPSPIFVTGTALKAGVILQQEGFNAGSKHPEILGISSEPGGVITPFRNVGRWVESPVQSELTKMINLPKK